MTKIKILSTLLMFVGMQAIALVLVEFYFRGIDILMATTAVLITPPFLMEFIDPWTSITGKILIMVLFVMVIISPAVLVILICKKKPVWMLSIPIAVWSLGSVVGAVLLLSQVG